MLQFYRGSASANLLRALQGGSLEHRAIMNHHTTVESLIWEPMSAKGCFTVGLDPPRGVNSKVFTEHYTLPAHDLDSCRTSRMIHEAVASEAHQNSTAKLMMIITVH